MSWYISGDYGQRTNQAYYSLYVPSSSFCHSSCPSQHINCPLYTELLRSLSLICQARPIITSPLKSTSAKVLKFVLHQPSACHCSSSELYHATLLPSPQLLSAQILSATCTHLLHTRCNKKVPCSSMPFPVLPGRNGHLPSVTIIILCTFQE